MNSHDAGVAGGFPAPLKPRTRGRVLALLLVATALLSGCSDGPAGVANKFVSATEAQNFVEAAGYLASAPEGDADAEEAVKAIAPPDAKADYSVDQQSDATAKVIRTDAKSSYMTLRKTDGHWLIEEVGYSTQDSIVEPLPYETEYQEDGSIWDGMEQTSRAGLEGGREVAVRSTYVNGVVVDETRTEGKVVATPVSEIVKRGTKDRSTGKTFAMSGHLSASDWDEDLPGGSMKMVVRVNKVSVVDGNLLIQTTQKLSGYSGTGLELVVQVGGKVIDRSPSWESLGTENDVSMNDGESLETVSAYKGHFPDGPSGVVLRWRLFTAPGMEGDSSGPGFAWSSAPLGDFWRGPFY